MILSNSQDYTHTGLSDDKNTLVHDDFQESSYDKHTTSFEQHTYVDEDPNNYHDIHKNLEDSPLVYGAADIGRSGNDRHDLGRVLTMFVLRSHLEVLLRIRRTLRHETCSLVGEDLPWSLSTRTKDRGQETRNWTTKIPLSRCVATRSTRVLRSKLDSLVLEYCHGCGVHL